MKAVQLVRWEAEPELREVERPEPGPGGVLVRVEGAGLCHSDLHLIEWPAGTLPWELPFTLGHETAGTVEGVGAGVGGLGHVAVQLLRLLSPARIVAIDIRESARRLALDAGAHAALDAAGLEPGDVRAETGPAGAPLVLDFVGSDETLRTAAS